LVAGDRVIEAVSPLDAGRSGEAVRHLVMWWRIASGDQRIDNSSLQPADSACMAIALNAQLP
jgi:hypothetical protein